MVNRWFNPDEQFPDATGNALAGGQLFFYATGTSTKLNTYSDKALTIPNTNPVVLDSSGRAGAIFLQNLAYKVVFAPATDTDPPTSPIWTQDPVYTSDFSTVAQFQSVNGNPNGQLAGTAGSATIPASVAWDYVNDILYVCTTTGTSTTAVWTAVNPASGASATLPTPQGRLTLASQTPVMNTDVTPNTTVYYTPYTGLLVPIYNGTAFSVISIVSELSLGLVAAHAANQIYDLYIFLVSGIATLGSSPSWSAGSSGSVTAGSCARGTGAGGTALSRLSGILTNTVSTLMTYGPSGATTTIGPNQATYVGSMYMDATNGQISCTISYGQNRKFGLWNAYNRVPIVLNAGDATSNWTYTTATIRASNGAPASYTGTEFNFGSGTVCNGMVIFSGLPEEWADISFTQLVIPTQFTGQTASGTVGIGYNATTFFTGTTAKFSEQSASFATGTFTVGGTIRATYNAPPFIGINNIASLEIISGTDGAEFVGTQGSMLLQANWRG